MSANVQIGPGTEFLTSGREYLHDREHCLFKTVVLDKVTQYSGSSVLPKGLALGKVTSSGKYQDHDDDQTDGTETFRGFLDDEIDLRDDEGAVQDTPARMCVFGRIKLNNTFWTDSNDQSNAQTDAAGGSNGCLFIWD